MKTPDSRRAPLLQWTIGLMTTGLLGSFFVFAPAASAVTVATPQNAPDGLSIAITDGAPETAPGVSSNYTVTITNRGTTAVAGELVVAVPAYVVLSEANGSHLEKTEATWKVTVAPGASERRLATARVGRIPAAEVRVTTLATLYSSVDRSRILVRAADANAIEGVLDPAHTVGHRPKTVSAAPDDPTFLVIGVSTCAALLTLATAGVVIFRRRRSTSAPATTLES